ncbi:MAG: phosphatase PAP2 family protein [Lachnospiraceae bacterium]|nr:phosphatase PAP2 family protein [Lachnospiraceae bacterium]
MKKETYIKMTQPFRNYPNMAKGLHILNQLCTGTMYISYPILLGYLFLQKDNQFLKAIIVPAISFIVLSLGRKWINRKRPYETFDMSPVIPKDTKGNSFPSRHVFSATMIAMTFLVVSPWKWLGVLFFFVSCLLAVVRVVSGVHYISDVLAGIVFAIVCSIIGFL